MLVPVIPEHLRRVHGAVGTVVQISYHVAGIYGMNFQLMPELGWTLGYPMALVAMVISAIVPFFFFRWKGWL